MNRESFESTPLIKKGLAVGVAIMVGYGALGFRTGISSAESEPVVEGFDGCALSQQERVVAAKVLGYTSLGAGNNFAERAKELDCTTQAMTYEYNNNPERAANAVNLAVQVANALVGFSEKAQDPNDEEPALAQKIVETTYTREGSEYRVNALVVYADHEAKAKQVLIAGDVVRVSFTVTDGPVAYSATISAANGIEGYSPVGYGNNSKVGYVTGGIDNKSTPITQKGSFAEYELDTNISSRSSDISNEGNIQESEKSSLSQLSAITPNQKLLADEAIVLSTEAALSILGSY